MVSFNTGLLIYIPDTLSGWERLIPILEVSFALWLHGRSAAFHNEHNE